MTEKGLLCCCVLADVRIPIVGKYTSTGYHRREHLGVLQPVHFPRVGITIDFPRHPGLWGLSVHTVDGDDTTTS